MTKKNNVKKSPKLDKKEHQDTKPVEASKRKTQKKLRLHSKLKVNVPLSQSLMLILPSLAKHASAETNTSIDDAKLVQQEFSDNQKSDVHQSEHISKDENQKQITRNIHDSNVAADHELASQQSETTLRPSHHLSSLSHPQVHYVPASSLPSIGSGGVTAPSNNVPTTPSLPTTFAPEVIKGIYGELHVDSGGKYTFVLNPLSPQYVLLHQNQPGTDKFVLHLSNGSSVVVQIPVTGKQDIPTISGDLHGIVTEDSNVDSHGLLNAAGKIDVVDPDHDQSSLLAETITGKYGTLTIDSNGAWHYQVDNSLPNIQALTSLTSLHESFTIHTKDGTPQTIEMTVGGIDDNAVVSGLDTGTLVEDSTLHAHGQLTVSDPDLNQDHFQAEQLQGHLGTLSIQPDGTWTYDLDNTNPKVQSLSKGSTITDIITVHSADGTPHQITLTINGTNDAATVSTATVAIDETDKVVTTSGTLTSTDVDNPDNTFTPDSISGTNGDLTIDANGHWNFTANSAFNQLNVGDKVEETFTVSSVDGTPATIKVTINGTNDKATVSSATVAIDETDKAVTTSGTLTSTDVDNPDNAFTPDSIVGANGDLTIDANGHWTFTANSAFNQLNVGDKVTETFNVTSVDGTPSTIKVTINGTNDKATVSSATVAIDETDKAVTTSGTLTSTDVDNTDNTFTPDSIIGTNGNLNIDANGHWTFTANSAFNQLNVGDKVEETFTVSSVDGTPSTIKVTINGTNDAATVSSATVAIDETDKAITTSGTLTSTDIDNPDNTFTPDSISGTNGDLTIDANGHWAFTANSAFNQLNVGDKVEETFTVSSVDGTPATIKVTINGTNDKATVSSATVAIDETDKAVTTSGTLTSTDVDNPDNTFAPNSITGTNGNLNIDANGQWTFTANSAFNQLNVGDKVEETFTVSSIDGTPSTIKVTINGTNDKATVSTATVSVDETDSAITTSGTLTSTDVDNPDNTFTPDSISGANGNLTIDANGHWVFTANSAFNQLNVGDKVEETFTVSSVDGTPSTIKVTINGTNDVATVSSATVAIDETDKAVTTSGTLTSADVDNTDNAFTPSTVSGANGDFNIDSSGQWTFTANSAFNQLNVGDKVEETFTVSSVDGTPSTIKVTINGTNDQATVSSVTVSIDETDKAVITSGTLTSTDVDNPDNTFTPDSISGTNGNLTIDANGHWVFTANSAFNQLNVGDKVEETFTVSSVDGTPSTIKVTINGTNDVATVSSATVAIDETDKAVTTSGTLTSTDVDNPDNTFTPDSIVGSNGDLTIDANGHWTFTANSAFNQLNVGDKVEETFTISSIDGTPSTIKVAINGTNDKATVSSATVAIDETDKAVTTSGTLTSADVDNPDNAFTPDSITGSNGNLNIDADGHWNFTANSAFNQLNVGDKVEETFTVSSIDGTPSTIKVTINGTNDKATVSSATVAINETDKAVTTSGTLTSTDIDNTDNAFTPDSISGTNGNLTIDANGHWVFTANSAFNQLNVDDKVEETFTVNSIDGTPSTIKVTINGTNDKATVSSATVVVDETDTAVTTSGTLTSTDVDNPDNTFTPDSISGTNGDLTIGANGQWTFTANSAFNQLNVGDKVEETFTVSSVDGTSSTIKVTINGTNDKAAVSTATVSVGETDKAITTSGTITSTDVDNPDNTFTPDSISGTNGDLTIDANGQWTFTANSAFNQLNVGDKVEETFIISSIDGTPSTIKVTINGTNDKPTIAAQSHSVTEDGQLLQGQMAGTDIDDGAQLTYSVANPVDGLTLNKDGSYSFDPSNSTYQHLADKQTQTLTIPVTITDEHNSSSTENLTITITGTGDAAIIGGVDTGSVIEKTAGDNMSPDFAHSGMATLGNSVLYADGQLTIVDADKGEQGFASHTNAYNYHGTYGDLILNPDGSWHYVADAGSVSHIGGRPTTRGTAIDQLGKGDTLTDTITVHSIDGTTHDIVITINGSNDRPYCSSKVQLNSGKEDLAQTITATELLANTIDVDSNDLGKLTVANLHADHGSILDNQDGTYTFTPTKDYNGQIHFSYDVTDAHGGTTHTGASTTLTATPDGAIISEVTTDHVTEDGSHSSHNAGVTTELANGRLQVVDPDSGENKFQYSQFGESAVHDPFGGMLRIDSMGNWGYSVNNANLQHLAQGQTETVIYRVHSYDGTAYELHIDVVGTNDAPTVTQVALSNGTEDTHYQMQASQFGFTDVDTGDTLHSIAITDIPPATQGKFVLDGHDITAGQHIPTADISKLQFVPAQNFNGDVQFKYTVNDGHTDSTEATNTLHFDAVGDVAVITGTTTGDVDEGHGSFGNMSPDYAQPGMAKLGQSALTADGKLDIVDPDTGESQFDSKGGAWNNSYHGQYGHLLLNTDGTWHYDVTVGNVDWVGNRKTTVGTTIDELGENQTLTDTITIYSKDGTAHDIVITIHGDNDRPYISSEVTLATGTEDTAQTLTTADLLTNTVDVDANDVGKLSIENLVSDHGSLLDNKDGTFTFTPEKDYNGTVHFSYDVKDAHGGVTHTGATTTFVAVQDNAIISGVDTGSVTENTAGKDMSPDHAQPGMSHLTGAMLYADGKLSISDPDAGENEFDTNQVGSQGYTYHGSYGQLILNADGSWHYNVNAGSQNNGVMPGTVGTAIDKLGDGESLTDTITIRAKDGTTHDIVITIHGSNDRPYCSSEVQLHSGKEDTAQTLTTADLLANTVDVDANDASQLSIANLVSDHGVVIDNKDGTFTFNPDKDYNGQVHFTYDVKDAHGGITHTGATTTLAAVNDAALFSVDDTGSVKEDVHVQGDSQHTVAVSGVLIVSDPDAGESEFVANRNVHAVSDPFGGDLSIGRAGDWTYSVSNNNLNRLAEGEKHQVTYEVVSRGGDKHQIVITVVGTNDDHDPILSVTQTTPTTGTLTETDVDVKDTHTFSVVSSTGQFGSISVDPDSGAYVYTANSSVAGMAYNKATHTYHGTDVFEVKVADNHGGESSTFITFDTNGHISVVPGQQPTISTSVLTNPLITAIQPSLPTGTNTPPNNGVTVDLITPSDTGKSNTDNVTKETTPTITGHTDIPYSQVTIYDGSTPIGHAVSDASGQYSAVVSNLTDGDHNLSAKALAPSSSIPATSSLLSVHVDTVIAPLTIALTHDTGSSNSDLVTHDGALTIGGQEVGATVEYSTDSGHTWTSSFTPQQGSNSVNLRQTDTAGNVSANTSLNFTLDNSITPPTVSLAHDTGRYSTNTPDLITKDSQLSIQTEAGAKVEYSNDGGHSWSSVFNPVEGVNNLQVRQTDIAGNLSPVTHFSFTLDTTPGTVTVNPISQDNALNATENNQPLVITGTTSNIDPGDVVYVVVGNNHFYDATVKSDGSWSLTLSASVHQNILASDHDYPIQVGTVDTAGNSTPRISTQLLIDTQNPIPHITVDSVTQDNVLNALESGQSIPITGTVTGDYHAGDTVSLKINGANILSLTGTVDASGHFSIPVDGRVLERANIHTSYASGQAAPIHSIEATIQTTDAVGNTGSATTGSQVFTVDTQIHVAIQTDPITADNVINAQESNSSVDITGGVSGDFNVGDIVTLNVNGAQHTGAVDSQGHYSIAVPGSELTADADQKIEASIAVTDSAGNSTHTTTDVVYQVDTQVSVPTITFENTGADNLYSKAEIARGHANTITATVTPPGDAKIGEHLVVNGQDHVLDAHTLQHGIQIEVHPGSNVQATMTDEHGNTAGSQGFAASAIPEPIVVRPPSGSHQVSGTLGIPPQLPSLTPVPTTQHGWRIHLPNGQYVTSHHGQYGTLTIDPQTGNLHYQEQANVHTGPHGSASGIGQHEDKFEVALQGTNQDEVVAHVNIQILSHGPGHSGKLNIGTEVVDMTITPIAHSSHPAPPPPPPVQHDEPDMASQADFTVTLSDDSNLDLTQQTHQEPDEKTSHHGAAAYLDALGIKPDATSTTVHDQPADMDIVLAQVDHQDATTHDQAHLDMSDALEHHDANINHNQDDEHHHHDIDGLPDIDPNS